MTKKLMLGAAVGALMVSSAFAQSPTPSSPSASSPPAASSSSSPSASMPTAGAAEVIASQKPDQWVASNFKGTDVVGADDAKIGDVSDILFDKNGNIQAFVISVGGFLGVGSKEVALAPKAFTVVPGQNGGAEKLKTSMSKDDLKSAQNFARYEAPRPVTTGAAPGGTGSRPAGAPPVNR